MPSPYLHITCETEEDTTAFAARLAQVLKAGDTLLLEGDIGAGKSAFARAMIRHLAGAEIEVPSPTFTLVQTYDCPDITVWHCDLYRLTDPDEVLELGLDDAFTSSLCLIEWPDRLGDAAPGGALALHFAASAENHTIDIALSGTWATRLAGLDG